MKKRLWKIVLVIFCFLLVPPTELLAGTAPAFPARDGKAVFHLRKDFQIDADEYKMIWYVNASFEDEDVWFYAGDASYNTEELKETYQEQDQEENNVPEAVPKAEKIAVQLFAGENENWTDCFGICPCRGKYGDSSFSVTVEMVETGDSAQGKEGQSGDDLYILMEQDQVILPLQLAAELYGFEAEVQENVPVIKNGREVFSETPRLFVCKNSSRTGITLEECDVQIQEEDAISVQQIQKETESEVQETVATETETQAETEQETVVMGNVMKPGTEKLTENETESDTETELAVVVETQCQTEEVLSAMNLQHSTEQKTEKVIETESETELETETETESQAANATESERRSKEAFSVTHMERQAEVKTEKITETETERQTEVKAEKITETGTERQTEVKTEKITETGTECQTEAKTEKITETETEHQTKAKTEQITETETERQTETIRKNAGKVAKVSAGLILLPVLLVLFLIFLIVQLCRRRKTAEKAEKEKNQEEKKRILVSTTETDDEDTVEPVKTVKKGNLKTGSESFCIRGAVISNKGRVRGNNEDNFCFNGTYMQAGKVDEGAFLSNECRDQVQLYAVCDGMGGADSGEDASYKAVRELAHRKQEYQKWTHKEELTKVLRTISDDIYKEAAQKGQKSGTTVVMMLVAFPKVVLANVGDSRIYRFRGRKLTQVSLDHSKVQRMISMGLLTPEQAKTDPSRHVITQYLGMPSEIKVSPHIVSDITLQKGDVYVLCSDGLTDMVEDEQLEAILREKEDPREAVQALFQTAMNHGGRDNVTIMLLFV